MKKIIVLSFLALVCASNCKKKSDSKNSQNYCVYTTNNGVKTIHGCATSKEDMQKQVIDLNNQGLISGADKVNSCSDCK